jgi:16S rRNA (guanine966-N2)-methyltransferase
MRIIGGQRRGAKLSAPPGPALRPTAERTREAIFNILVHGVEDGDPGGQSVLDVFAGIGAMGLEALSRGAKHATFIDNAGTSIATIRSNIEKLEWQEWAKPLRADATTIGPPPVAAQAPCGLVFLDPPYQSGLVGQALTRLARQGWIAGGAVCVVEVAAKETLETSSSFSLLDERRYGAARIIILRHQTALKRRSDAQK